MLQASGTGGLDLWNYFKAFHTSSAGVPFIMKFMICIPHLHNLFQIRFAYQVSDMETELSTRCEDDTGGFWTIPGSTMEDI